jgi:hypothetical protein
MESKENPTCGSCHNEHIGATHLANTADSTCTQCHANLETRSGTLKVASHVDSFAREHPDFRPLRLASYQERAAAFALRFNHAEHMKPGLTGGPNGPENLTCQSCHVTSVNAEGKQSYGMAPVSFEKSCQSCHGLEFDTHIKQQAPHADPAIVRAFVTQQITGFAQAHPDVVAAEIRNWPTEAPLPSKMPMAPPHTPAEWIANRTARAEIILYREKCELCHKDLNRDSPTEPTFLKASFQTELTPSPASDMPSPMQSSPMQSTSGMSPSAMLNSIQLPRIENAHQPERWYKGAIFSHPAHQAEECVDCHAAALTSVNGTDLLMPSISTCRRCHNGESSPQGPPVKVGHAESGCFLCHVYHGPHGPDLTSNHTLAQLLSSH